MALCGRSICHFSSKRIESFLDEIFGDEENIKTSRFLTKFNLLQNCVIDNIVDGKFKPIAETLVPQFTVEVGAAGAITDTTGVEPDATKKGAFFFVGIVSVESLVEFSGKNLRNFQRFRAHILPFEGLGQKYV